MRLVLFTLSIGAVIISVFFSAISAGSPDWCGNPALCAVACAAAEDAELCTGSTLNRLQEALSSSVARLACSRSVINRYWTGPNGAVALVRSDNPRGASRAQTLHLSVPRQDLDCRIYRRNSLNVLQEAGSSADDTLPEDSPLQPSVLTQILHESHARDSHSSNDVFTESTDLGEASSHERRYSSFCSLWRVAGYTSQLSLVFGLGALFSLLIVMGGGRNRRRAAWPICAGLVGLHATFQIVTMALVAHVYRTDERFWMGSYLGFAFHLSTASWVIEVLLVLVMVITGAMGQWEIPPKEGERKPLLDSARH